MHDVLIAGGLVFDGTGSPARRADVAIAGGIIAEVSDRPLRAAARRTVEADGLTVAPGFIDMHSHADFTLPNYPDALNSISQGVTTEVLGNCGYSPAPLAMDPELRAGQVLAALALGPDLDWSWRSFADYVARLDAARPAVNCVLLVGHGTLRLAVVGGEDRPPTSDESKSMRAHVVEALDAGAFGMSSGLVYPPGSFASTEELVEVGQPLADGRGLYASHIRSEGGGLLEALAEAVDIGRRLRTQVEVSHLKAAGIPNHGRTVEALELLDEARAERLPVGQDGYPYTAGSTLLTQLLPPWAQDGGIDALVARLRSDEVRARLRHEVGTGLPGWMSYAAVSGGWERIMLASVVDPALRGLEGRTIAEVAQADAVDPLELVFDTLVADHAATTMIVTLMAEPDVERVLSHRETAIGSDQFVVTSRTARVHPRCYGAFARVLGRIVRERGLVTLPEAIRRMTGLPATVLRLTDRGRIATGMIADVVAFDAERILDRSTYANPTELATGVEAVLLGGRLAVEGGAVVDAHLGRVLRRSA